MSECVECGLGSVIVYHEGACIGGEHDDAETSVWQRESCGLITEWVETKREKWREKERVSRRKKEK